MREHATSEKDRRRAAEERTEAPAPLHAVLALQRQAGNRAVSAMLARYQEEQRAAEPVKGGGATLDMGEPIGTIPIESFSWTGDRGREVTVYSPFGDHAPRIADAAAKGRAFPVVVLSSAGVRLTMRQVLVAGYQAGSAEGGVITFTLNFAEVEHKFAGSG